MPSGQGICGCEIIEHSTPYSDRYTPSLGTLHTPNERKGRLEASPINRDQRSETNTAPGFVTVVAIQGRPRMVGRLVEEKSSSSS